MIKENNEKLSVITIVYNCITGATVSEQERYAEPITQINSEKKSHLNNVLQLIRLNRTKNK